MSKVVTYLHIHAINQMSAVGRLHVGHRIFPCLLGKNGRTARKCEGDGKSPIGVWALRSGFYRADRLKRPCPVLVMGPMRITDAWCDDSQSRLYNRQTAFPIDSSHERLWREDGAYDIVFPTSHNERPRIKGKGSAIFLHLTRNGFGHTAGCIAVSPANMLKILAGCKKQVWLVIWPCQGNPPALRRK